MNNQAPEPTINIPVDLYNPGQFFACCGLLELAARKWGVDAKGSFGSNNFNLFVPSTPQDVKAKLLNKIEIYCDECNNPITPLDIKINNNTLHLDWWLNIPKSTKDNSPFKTWSGNQKIYGTLLSPLLSETKKIDDLASGFHYSVNLSGRLGVDVRSSWNKIDAGFSPNTQGLTIPTYVMVEFLASIGLQRFRPIKINKGERKRDGWLYWVWQCNPLPVQLASSAANILEENIQFFKFMVKNNGKYKYFSRANKQNKEKHYDEK